MNPNNITPIINAFFLNSSLALSEVALFLNEEATLAISPVLSYNSLSFSVFAYKSLIFYSI